MQSFNGISSFREVLDRQHTRYRCTRQIHSCLCGYAGFVKSGWRAMQICVSLHYCVSSACEILELLAKGFCLVVPPELVAILTFNFSPNGKIRGVSHALPLDLNTATDPTVRTEPPLEWKAIRHGSYTLLNIRLSHSATSWCLTLHCGDVN